MVARLEESLTSATSTASVDILNDFNVSVSGTFAAIVDLQRSFDGGVTWVDVDSYTAPVEREGCEPETGVKYRFDVPSYTSGTVVLRISR